MTKQDLKDGMILETVGGERYLLTNGVALDFEGYLTLENYSEDLKNKYSKTYDIVKVYKGNSPFSLTEVFQAKRLTLIWEHKEPELPDKEIEVLKALKTLGYKYLARDSSNSLFGYADEPEKAKYVWVRGKATAVVDDKLFNSIKWEDKEPTKIMDLLKGN